jgi:transposase
MPTKYTKRYIQRIRIKGCIKQSGEVNDYGFMHIHKAYDVTAKTGKGTKTYLAHEVGCSRATVARILKKPCLPEACPSNNALRIPPKKSAAQIAAMNRRREYVLDLVHRTEKITRTRLTPKLRRVSCKKTFIKHPFDNPLRIKRQLKNEFDIEVSKTTVRNDLIFLGLRAFKAGKQPGLTPDDKKFRVKMMKKYLKHDWTKFIFVDEKIFTTNGVGSQWTWSDIDNPPEWGWDQEQDSQQMNVLGAIGHNFHYWHCVPGVHGTASGVKVDADYYIEHLLKPITKHILDNDLIFVEDGSGVHSGKKVAKYLEDVGIKKISPEQNLTRCGRRCWRSWPPRSPDLNPIENMWAYLGKGVADARVFSRDDMEEQLRKAVQALDIEKVNKLCEHFPKWADTCIKTGGDVVK